jgi:proteic killer suppression protein
MDLVRFRHKGLRLLYADDTAKGVPPAAADKLRKLLMALQSATSLEQVGRFPGWRLHADIDLIDYH